MRVLWGALNAKEDFVPTRTADIEQVHQRRIAPMTIDSLMKDRAALTAQIDAVPTDLVRQDGCRRRSTQDYL